jgi:hypothetical protein
MPISAATFTHATGRLFLMHFESAAGAQITQLLWGYAALSGTGLARPTAVLAGFISIHNAVRAGGGLADACPADAAQALGRELATLT